MAKALGVPDFPMAIIEHESGIVTAAGQELAEFVAQAVPQVEHILLYGS